MIGADTICSRGSNAKYKGVQRIAKINDQLMMASAGDFSDFTHIANKLQILSKKQ